MIDIENWGLIDYETAWKRQAELHKLVQSGHKKSTLVLCEHPSVITLGRNSSVDNIRLSADELITKGIRTVEINRGGDVTLHNPGQLVGYVIFRLTDYKQDLHWFLREIEECIIEVVAEYYISAGRLAGFTGVWLDENSAAARKICAIGIHCSRWVTMHGFALNVNNSLAEFSYIVPCGISDKPVTSLSLECQKPLDFQEIIQKVIDKFQRHF